MAARRWCRWMSPALLMVVAVIEPAHAQDPVLRELFCRGGATGLEFRVVNDPSPDGPTHPKHVRMALRYRRDLSMKLGEPATIAAGSCGWDMTYNDVEPPAEVQFDIEVNAQSFQAARGAPIDRSMSAAAAYPDTASIRRYLTVPTHFWRFFVYDRGRPLATVHGAVMPDLSQLSDPSTSVTERPTTPERAGARLPTEQSGTLNQSRGRQTAAGTAPARLRFRSVDRTLNGFTVRFSARPSVSATVNYSTEKPVRSPQGVWFFTGAASDGTGRISLGGLSANVTESKSSAVMSNYAGATRFAPSRGQTYHFIITAPGGPGIAQEQYVGQLVSGQQDVRLTMDFKITKSNLSSGNTVEMNYKLYVDRGAGFVPCENPCQNAPDVVGILAWARPALGNRSGDPTWTSVSGKNTGIGRLTVDTRTIPAARPTRHFTFRSMPGEIEFEAWGTLDVVRR